MNIQAVRPRVGPRARSRPRAWPGHRAKRGWRHAGVDPRSRAPKGVLSFWTRARRLLWSWWPWALVGIWAIGDARWGWAIGSGVMAMFSYLIAPPAAPPRYGLDHEFAVDSAEFVGDRRRRERQSVPAAATPRAAQQRRRVLPAHARGDRKRPGLDHDRGLHLLGRRHRAVFAEALAGRAKAGVKVKILLDAIGSASIGADILDVLESAAAARSPGTTRSAGTRSGRFNNRTHRKSLIVDGRIAFTGGAGIADHWRGNASGTRRMARYAGPPRRPGGRPAADRVRSQLAADDRRAAHRRRRSTRS